MIAKEVPPADGLEMDKKEIVAAVMIHDKIIAHSAGKSGRYARVRAANNAIDVLGCRSPAGSPSCHNRTTAVRASVDSTLVLDANLYNDRLLRPNANYLGRGGSRQ